MLISAIILIAIAVAAALAFRYSSTHHNDCAACSGDCGGVCTNKSARQLYKEVKEAEMERKKKEAEGQL